MRFQIIYTSERAREVYEKDGGIKYATPGSCAFDVRAILPEGETEVRLKVGEQRLISCGFKIQAAPDVLGELLTNNPEGIMRIAGMLIPRSGTGSKKGLVLGNTVGLIDTDYQGEVLACVWHRPIKPLVSESQSVAGLAVVSQQFNTYEQGLDVLTIPHGERIAQYVLVPVIQASGFDVVDEFEVTTARGQGGFGSTGSH